LLIIFAVIATIKHVPILPALRKCQRHLPSLPFRMWAWSASPTARKTSLRGSVLLMPALQSDDPNVETDESGGVTDAMRKVSRETLFTIGWAAAGLVGSTLYFIA
jgi:hypothetical protein